MAVNTWDTSHERALVSCMLASQNLVRQIMEVAELNDTLLNKMLTAFASNSPATEGVAAVCYALSKPMCTL